MFLELISKLGGLLQTVMQFFTQRQMLNAGRAESEADNAAKAIEDIRTATDARDATRRADLGVHRTDELPDDGFRRD